MTLYARNGEFQYYMRTIMLLRLKMVKNIKKYFMIIMYRNIQRISLRPKMI